MLRFMWMVPSYVVPVPARRAALANIC